MRVSILLALGLAVACGNKPVPAEKPVTEPHAPEATPHMPTTGKFALAIHGGAGNIGGLTPAQRAPYTASLTAALRRGQELLQTGTSSLDVVEAVVAQLEDDPLFNAGRGSVFNAKGEHELDASIMRGSDRQCGAVAGVRSTKNPIHAARAVMDKTKHIVLSGEGADDFASEQSLEQVPNSYFSTEARRDAWQLRKQGKHGTVGAVALDMAGHLAAATSTGGLSDKQWGRIGDSPIIGAGTYADDRSCAVSGTGIGEEFIRHAAAFSVSARMRWLEESAQEASNYLVQEVLKPGQGGVIVVSHAGNIAFAYNTAGMFRGATDSTGRFEVMITETPETLDEPSKPHQEVQPQ